MDALAVLLKQPKSIGLDRLTITTPEAEDVVVEIAWSGVSTGTERLLWSGSMPEFPGMGYPLVPGYESVGRVIEAGPMSGRSEGDWVFVPGAHCFGEVRGLFGGAASRVTLPGVRVTPIDENLGEQGVLLALAATAYHCLAHRGSRFPDLIIGHGVLGRLIARLVIALGGEPPTVWEINADRAEGAVGYHVIDPAEDSRRDYQCICDVSGDTSLVDKLVSRMDKGGELVLAGFYPGKMTFDFAAAFMKEARFRIAAEFTAEDLREVSGIVGRGVLSLEGLITHHSAPEAAGNAYETAFSDAGCLKMVLDWREG